MAHDEENTIESKSIANRSRRKAVKTIVGGVTAVAAYNVLPARWGTPIIEQVFLPAHATTSGMTINDDEANAGEAVSLSSSLSELSVSEANLSIDSQSTITILLKGSDGNAWGRSGGVLTLQSSPSGPVFSNIIDNGDGTYSASVESASRGTFDISASMDSTPLTTTSSVRFTQVDPANTTMSPTNNVLIVGNTSNVTVTLRESDGSLVGHGGHTVIASSDLISIGIIPYPSVTDNNDGTYSLGLSCALGIAFVDTITVYVDGVDIGTYTLDCD